MKAIVRDNAPITAAQIKKIHALKRALGMDDEQYRFILHDSYQVTSSKGLNCYQAGDLIEVMESKAVESGTWKRWNKQEREISYRPGMASPEQIRKIEIQWREVSRVSPEDQAKALRRFIERVAKVSALRFLDQEGAGKVLNALKAMNQRLKTQKQQNAQKWRSVRSSSQTQG